MKVISPLQLFPLVPNIIDLTNAEATALNMYDSNYQPSYAIDGSAGTIYHSTELSTSTVWLQIDLKNEFQVCFCECLTILLSSILRKLV